jgi:5-methyltetrahydrofolate--homocysteine methyltransferase
VHVTDKENTRLEFIRQQSKKAEGQPNFSLADFIAPESSGLNDYIGAFSVTIKNIEPHIKKFEDAQDDYNKIMLQALADRLVEAYAECLHEKVRKEYWGYTADESLDNEALIQEKYPELRGENWVERQIQGGVIASSIVDINNQLDLF